MIHVSFIVLVGAGCAGGGSGMFPLRVTKTGIYHGIHRYFGISKVKVNFEILNQVEMGYLFLTIISQFNKDIPG